VESIQGKKARKKRKSPARNHRANDARWGGGGGTTRSAEAANDEGDDKDHRQPQYAHWESPPRTEPIVRHLFIFADQGLK